ncbi:MAG: hypothetical protein MRERC_3c077 [Mycoplasmataceae bacterium RC_NB112A]|nr:MAG: hypothetical protein MRERC_3c077 [Mycoplasmataceae bacterium RC_NB112A]
MKELLIIKTSESKKIKSILDREHIDYQIVYDDILQEKNLTEEEVWKRDAYLVSQDKEREKELKEWDKITSKIDDE